MQMSALLTKMLLFVVVIALGMFGAKKKILAPEFNRGLSWLLVNFFIVASIFNSVISMDAGSLSMRELGRILLISTLTIFLLYAIAAIVVRVLPVEKEKVPQLELLMGTINNLFVTLPVVETIYGAKGAFIIALGCIPFNLFLFTYGIARLRGGDGGFRFKDLLSAPLVATIAAVAVFALRIPVPAAVRSILSAISGATVPLSMLLVGASLGNVSLLKALRDRTMPLLCGVRFLLAPVVIYFVMKLVCHDDMLANAMVITAASPCAIIVTALSLQTGRSGEYSSEGILLTTLLSLVTLPITAYLIL